MREYVRGAPSPQVALDLFEDEWASKVPIEATRSGDAPLFADARVDWVREQLGGLDGARVLELGPLEGGHTAGLLRAGAAEVLGVEANVRAFLRCLLVKELVGLTGARFVLGDADAYVRAAAAAWDAEGPAFDLVFASGLLYHMADPVALLEAVGRLTDQVFVWTHHVDLDVLEEHDPSGLLQRLGPATTRRLPDGREVTYHPHGYALDAITTSFCGGADDASTWMDLPGLHATLDSLGFTERTEAFRADDHPNGPAIAILARRAHVRPAVQDREVPAWGLGGTEQVADGPRVPHPSTLEALTTERAQLQDELAALSLSGNGPGDESVEQLRALMARRDLRAVVRRAVWPWREG